MKILVAEPDAFSNEARQILESIGDVDYRLTEQSELGEAMQIYDAIWFRLGLRIGRDATSVSNRKCRFVCTPVTGIDHIDVDACRADGIIVLCLKGETEFLRQVRATAELTMGITLALLRRIPQAASDVLSGNWDRDRFRGSEIFGKTVGIVGYGRLGSMTADYFVALRARVLVYDPFANMDHPDITPCSTLSELLTACDIVSLHVSYDESTRHLLNDTTLSQMKPGAVLVNTSRGGVIDEQALVRALEAGRLSGAALDVLQGEPNIGENHCLVEYARNHDNLLVTPHIGGNTRESFVKTEVFLAERLVGKLQTEPRTLSQQP